MRTYELGYQPTDEPGRTRIQTVDAENRQMALVALGHCLQEQHRTADFVRWVQQVE